MDEYDQKQHVVQEMHESPYDIESEIKVIKRFQLTQMNDQDLIIFFGPVYDDVHQRRTEITAIEVSLSQSEEATADNILDEMADLKAFSDKQSGPLGHLRADLFSLSNKVKILEYSITKKVTKKLEESLPRMEPLNKELNALNTVEIQRFEDLKKELLSAIRKKVGKSVKKCVWKEMDIVKDCMSYCGSILDKGDVNILELVNLMKDIVSLLDSASVFRKDNPEGERRVEGTRGLVIKEPKSRIFFYNGNFDLVFQREEEFHLASTAHLIRLQNAIQGALQREIVGLIQFPMIQDLNRNYAKY
nr:hypothetical protein [Tanacetum cinerariifolium]